MCEPREERYLGLAIYRLSKRIREEMQRADARDQIPQEIAKCGWMIGLIARNEGDIYQKDLESMIPLAKSTITGIVQTLERGGLLRRIPVERDARLKKVVLTQKGQDFQKRSADRFRKLEDQLRAGISPEDLDCFSRVIDQMSENFEVKL